jgi:membrane glycosyltransferase
MFYMGVKMSFDEKRAWIQAVVAVCAYGIYLAIVLGRAGQTPLAEVHYVSTLLWTVGGAIVAGIVLHILAGLVSGKGGTRKDQRDREINRFGERVGQSLVVVGAVGALLMAMAELRYFWIANAIYLAFVLSAVLGSVAKIAAYRRGFQ